MDRTQHNGFSTSGRVHAAGIAGINPWEIVNVLRTHARLWIIPTVVCTVLAAGYALVASRDWRATQALIVRPEAASVSDERLGKFSDLSEMKTLQETILELAKSQGVLKSTLEIVGSPKSGVASWPSPLDVEEFRDQIDMRPPGGAEFGKTEVFYLSVLDHNRTRAGETLSVLCTQLEQRMQELRDQRAKSMVAELERTVDMAEGDLAARTQKLSQFEARIGADLVELRNMNATTGGQGEVSQELQTISTERRANESVRRENVRLLALLKDAQEDPSKILATPGNLLHSQPSLSRLKDALVDAQVRVAALLGTRSASHPYVVAARASEQQIREQLHNEIGAAIAGLSVDVALNGDREQGLAAKQQEARLRLSNLAEARAEYANLVSATDNHTKLVETARKNLADARARQAAAHSASVIARIDGVDAGVRPVGPGRTTITAAGGVAGLIFGLGLVFLLTSNSAASQIGTTGTGTSTGTTSAVGLESSYHDTFGLTPGVPVEEAVQTAEGNFAQRSGW